MLFVISTDIKSSSNLWKKKPERMFKALQWHHAILRACFNHFIFKICDSSPEGDAFIASKNIDSADKAIECIENIIFLMDYARRTNWLNVTLGEGYQNNIHIRIGLASGENVDSATKYETQGVTKKGKVCRTLGYKATVCSNETVFRSEQAETDCNGWTNHYKYGEETKQVEIKQGKVLWNEVINLWVTPDKEIKTGMVLFVHSNCKNNGNYCGFTETIVSITEELVKRGWIAIKIKRDKTAMLINLSITQAREAIGEFNSMTNRKVMYCAAFGDFFLVRNKRVADNYCFNPDAFGDTVNVAARMVDALAFIKNPKIRNVNKTSREQCNLGSGDIFVYKKKKIKF